MIAAAAAAVVGVAAGAVGVPWMVDEPAFDHEMHAGLFPSCLACHRGVEEAGAPTWPDPESCARCHDGQDSLDVVDWTPPSEPAPTNLVFAHETHARDVAADGEPAVDCVECHTPAGAAWLTVDRAVESSCLDCHGLEGEHLALADESCASCHSELAASPTLTTERIAAFAAPPSHDSPEFAMEHGEVTGESCAVCHARDFCVQCHVDAPEQAEIAELPADPRSLALAASMPEPAGHDAADFLATHGTSARTELRSCATCHTEQSCTTCHIGSPQLAASLPSAGPGRGAGAPVVRDRPASHDPGFLTAHGLDAAARPETCAGCHVRSDCTECHRPGAAASAGFHPPDFLARHPSAAYARETSCSDCHATAEFCTSCHASAGLASTEILSSSFHDGQFAFSVGHGAAARRSLETCASCHVEEDCMACHSATAGRGIDPHGPDFDAAAMRRANPQM
ncbi:MAG: hypothetical protein ACOC9N_02580, partial [Gemmatimonadota bacterium]